MQPLAGGVGQPDMLLERSRGAVLWAYMARHATDGVEVQLKECACMCVCVCVAFYGCGNNFYFETTAVRTFCLFLITAKNSLRVKTCFFYG